MRRPIPGPRARRRLAGASGAKRLLAALLALGLAGCDRPAAVRLTVDSDLGPGAETDLIRVAAWIAGAEVWSGSREVAAGTSFPLEIRFEPGVRETQSLDLRVAAEREGATVLEAWRPVGLVPGREVEVRVCLRAACLGSSDESCRQGLCDGSTADGDGDADGDTDADGDADADGDPCASPVGCDRCTATAGCGWCEDSSRCRAGTESGPAGGTCGTWRWVFCPGGWVDPGPDGPEVRIVYLHPTDRPPKEAYAIALERAARHVQTWYRDDLGNGETFRLHDPVVEVVASPHTAEWYSTNDSGGTVDTWWAENARADAISVAGVEYSDPNNNWLVYVDSEPACGQTGGSSWSGVSVMLSNDLRGLVGEPWVRLCPDDPDWMYEFPTCRWFGGLAVMTAYGFGLPAPPGCAAGEPTCDEGALTWAGFYSYPATYLRADDRAMLGHSRFFDVRDALPVFDCAAP